MTVDATPSAAAATSTTASDGFLGRFFQWKSSLPTPALFDNLQRETRSVFVTNFLFDGAKFDFAKFLSQNFQVSHSFALGSQVQPSSYHFGATYGTERYALQGNIDHEGGLQALLTSTLAPALTTKTQLQFSPQNGPSSLQSDLTFTTSGLACDVKAVNPWLDGTGIYVGSVMQALTPALSVGVQAAWQRPTVEVNEVQCVYAVRYGGAGAAWTATWVPTGVLQTAYWHKVSDKVELATELQVMAVQGKRDAVCSVGGKWDLRFASFRGQVDTTGRVSAVLEEKLAPGVSVLFSGDIDHFKGQSKFGIGFQMEN